MGQCPKAEKELNTRALLEGPTECGTLAFQKGSLPQHLVAQHGSLEPGQKSPF